VLGVQWKPFDEVGKKEQTDLLDNVYTEALRKLAPDMGAYVNEVCFPLTEMKTRANHLPGL
jgi:hypothetical protein